MWRFDNKGELSILLAITSLLVMIGGMLVGLQANKNRQMPINPAPKATESCVFSPTAFIRIRLSDGRTVPLTSSIEPDITSWELTNNASRSTQVAKPTTNGTISYDLDASNTPYCCGADNTEKGYRESPKQTYLVDKIPPYDNGDTATVTLKSMPTRRNVSYKVIETCGYNNQGRCEPVSGDNDGLTIATLPIGCLAYEYGWIVQEQPIAPTIQPTTAPPAPGCLFESSGCTPSDLNIEEVREDRVKVSWKRPSQCSSFKSGTDFFVVEIRNTNTQQLVCTKTAQDMNTTCKLSSNTKWENGVRYQTKVYLKNKEQPECRSSGVTKNFTHTRAEPKAPDPTQEPSDPSLVCRQANQPCVDDYRVACKTEDDRDGMKNCHKVGTCSGPGDGTKCSWGPGSSCGPCQAIGGAQPPAPPATSVPQRPPNRPQPTQQPPAQPPEKPRDGCNSSKVSGNGNTKVLIVGRKYGNNNGLFDGHVNNVIASFGRTTMPANIINSMSFYKMSLEESNRLNCSEWHCNSYNNARSQCGARAIIYLDPTDPWSKVNSGADPNEKWAYILMPETVTYPYLAPHEAAHAIANLVDEYVIPGKAVLERTNCRSSTTNFIGCSNSNALFRSSYNSIMRNHGPFATNDEREISTFRVWNDLSLQFWRESVGASGLMYSLDTAESFIYGKSLVLELISSNNNFSITSISVKDQYPDEQNLEVSAEGEPITINLFDQSNNVLWTTQKATKTTLVDSQPSLDTEPQIEIFSDGNQENFSVFLPYSRNIARVVIETPSGTIERDVGTVDSVGAKNLCGNNVCDIAVGETTSLCRSDCSAVRTEHIMAVEKNLSDIDGNMIVNTVDYLEVVDNYGLIEEFNQGLAADINKDGSINALDLATVIEHMGQPTETNNAFMK